MNNNCVAYKQVVSVNKGFGNFNLISEAIKEENCIVCGQNLYVTQKYGFVNCNLMYTAENNHQRVIKTVKSGLEYQELTVFKQQNWSFFEVSIVKCQ